MEGGGGVGGRKEGEYNAEHYCPIHIHVFAVI